MRTRINRQKVKKLSVDWETQATFRLVPKVVSAVRSGCLKSCTIAISTRRSPVSTPTMAAAAEG